MDTVLSVQRLFGPLGVFLLWCNLFKVHNHKEHGHTQKQVQMVSNSFKDADDIVELVYDCYDTRKYISKL